MNDQEIIEYALEAHKGNYSDETISTAVGADEDLITKIRMRREQIALEGTVSYERRYSI